MVGVQELCEQGGGPGLSFPIPFFPLANINKPYIFCGRKTPSKRKVGEGGGGGQWIGVGEGVIVASYAVVVGHAGANAEKAPCCTFSTSNLAYPQLLTALGKSAALKRRAAHSSMSGM